MPNCFYRPKVDANENITTATHIQQSDESQNIGTVITSRVDAWSTNTVARSIMLMLLIFITVFNNVSVQEMGYYMPIYVSFSLYFTTAVYTILFALTAIGFGESWRLTRQQSTYVCSMGLLTAVGGIFQQVSIPFIDPEYSAIFANIQSPLTWLMSFVMFRDRKFTVLHLCGTLVMTLGLLFGPLYSLKHGTGSTNSNNNPAWAILLALLSPLFSAALTIISERMFRELNAPKFVTLTYYNLISLPVYGLWIFSETNSNLGMCVTSDSLATTDCSTATRACHYSELGKHEADAFRCFFRRMEY